MGRKEDLSRRNHLKGQQEKLQGPQRWASKRSTIRRVKEMLVKSEVPPERQQGARARNRIKARSQEGPGGYLQQSTTLQGLQSAKHTCILG